jgi:sugar/nucleoside kinase (ribokinase family)
MKKPVSICGLINIETTVPVSSFPVSYEPVNYHFNGIHSTVSGVGFNLARALYKLGSRPQLHSLIGKDGLGDLVLNSIQKNGIETGSIKRTLDETGQSVILYDPQGKRKIEVDLKDMQEQQYDTSIFAESCRSSSIACICNINFARPLLDVAAQNGNRIATDVHVLSSLDDDYNMDFMRAADILFLSDEKLPTTPENFIRQICDRFSPSIVVIGMGANGAMLGLPEKR